MSAATGAGGNTLPLEAERRVNEVCNRFELAWQAGGRPRVEDYLGDAAGAERAALLRELVLLEVACRRRRGETPACDDYRARFPALPADWVAAAVAEPGPGRAGPDRLLAEGEVCRQFGGLPATLAAPDGAGAGATTLELPAPPAADRVPCVRGYELLGQLGHGGMGVVWRGRDRRLQREVAVKVLRAELAGQPALQRRFLEEAQIASQLATPSIPPVHELGELPDGRPYFAMKLVKGRTLAELLEARAGPADDRPRLLGIFEHVCQAAAYAHSKGVIHRDLKPANVMVGAFGEVQVMDWGLAKVLAARPAEAAAAGPPGSVVETGRAAGADDATEAGSVLGTFAYMAPEQARGEVERLDRRCDVFGLGAILCEVLTGRPPYMGTVEEVRAQAQLGHLAPARERLAACGADAELVELAGQCLSARAEERPEDGAAVAAAVTAHLAGVQERLRRAELERAAAQARAAEERKRRRVQLALAAAVLLVVAAVGGGAWWVQQERAARLRVVESALEKSAELRQQAHWGEAQAVLEQARAVLGDAGPDDLRRRLDVAETELALVKSLDAIRQRRATIVEGYRDYRTTAQDYAAAFQEAGLGKMGDDEEVVAARVRASGVAGVLVAALDDWASIAEDHELRKWLLEVARWADPDPWRHRFRDPAVWRDRQALQGLADEALRDDGGNLAKLSPQVLESLGLRLRDAGADAVPLLRAAQRRYPDDFWLNLDLGNVLYKAKQYEEAVGYYRVAVALRPAAAAAHNNLGAALKDKGDVDGAIAECRTAIALDHKYAMPHNNLGNALGAKGQLDEAIREYRTAIGLDPNHADVHTNLGWALRDKGDVDGAIAEYRTAIALDHKYAIAQLRLGVLLCDVKHEYDQAITCFRALIDIDHNHAGAHYNLGWALYNKGRYKEAEAAFREAIHLKPDSAEAHNSLGAILCDRLHRYQDAEASIREAIRLKADFPLAHYNLGRALFLQGRFAEAGKATRRSLELFPQRDPWRQAASKQLRQCEHQALDEKLSAILNGEAGPAGAAEGAALAQFCWEHRRLYAAAARLYADAFAADPKLAADLSQQHRYNAACSAALAAAGQGEDAKRLPDKAVAMLRRQAIGWLRDDLALYAKLAEGDAAAKQFVRQHLTHWREDTDLASVRDPAALDRLSDDERAAWRRLWEDVAALRQKVEQTR
jgi:serine/threonine-protein kinase